jgi:hypothetical protein
MICRYARQKILVSWRPTDNSVLLADTNHLYPTWLMQCPREKYRLHQIEMVKYLSAKMGIKKVWEVLINARTE